MRASCFRAAALALTVLVPIGTHSLAQTAVQGEVTTTEFHSPMILNTVLAATDQSLWQDGKWFSVKEYQELGKFTCDGVSLREDYKSRKGTWSAGLHTAAQQVDAEHVRVRFKATILNPEDNHDKIVSLKFDVLKGDTVLSSGVIKKMEVEEDSSGAHRETSVVLAKQDLETEPRPTLRITMTAVND